MTAERYQVLGPWIVRQTSGCTCSPDDYGHHEFGCGLEPVLRVQDDSKTVTALVGLLNHLERLVLHGGRLEIHSETCADCIAIAEMAT